MKGKYIAGIFAGVILVAGAALVLRGRESKPSASAGSPASAARFENVGNLVTAPGRVEPISEDIRLGSELNGKLREVLVDEGDHVHQGQVLAVLVNGDYLADVKASEAQLSLKQADLRKTVNGARREERRQAQATVTEAEAVLENARADMQRHKLLYDKGVVSREDADHYERVFKVAQAQYDEAAQHFKFIDEQTREEDVAHAQADVALGVAQLDEARARYEKTVLRSPIDGVVLRRYHRAGESVSNSSTAPDPIFALGDRDILRVRVDVDETDIARVALGDQAYVMADAYGTRKFYGHVVRLGGELGRKNVRTDEPTERLDTKILETLVQLDGSSGLPIGLRVDAYIIPNSEQNKN